MPVLGANSMCVHNVKKPLGLLGLPEPLTFLDPKPEREIFYTLNRTSNFPLNFSH